MLSNRDAGFLRQRLDCLYGVYNRRLYVEPDPLQFLYQYPDPSDREVVGFIASALAYGRVAQIVKSVARVLSALGPSPRQRLVGMTSKGIRRAVRGFRHRFTGEDELAALLADLRDIIGRCGSLNRCFLDGFDASEQTVLPAIRRLAARFTSCRSVFLVPDPAGNGAFKRMCLFLRWMVRQDDVDPGGWTGVPSSALVIPLDTHMFRVSRQMGLTDRRTAGAATVLDITAAFRRICPEDPVKYDFALTRSGIRPRALTPSGAVEATAKEGRERYSGIGRCDGCRYLNCPAWDGLRELRRTEQLHRLV